MNNENYHPIQKESPCAHALHRFDEKTRCLTYEYNGVDILSMTFPPCQELGFRHGSDGSMQSLAYAQQIYIMAKTEITIDVEISLTSQSVCMRDRRATADEPILSQYGNNLIPGIYSLYDPLWDLLLSFNGRKAYWKNNRFTENNGYRKAILTVEIGKKPLFINLFMHYYQNHLGYKYYRPWERRFNGKNITGWCSWEAYRRNIDQEKIKGISTFLAEKLKAYGLEYILVDDGYQKMPLPFKATSSMKDGWMTCEETKFPEGHEGIVKVIENEGFKPAIWTNANITNPEYPEYHKEDVLWLDGKALKGEWIDYLYSCTPENLEKVVQPIFRAYREKGYKYIKIDAIRHLLFDGLHEAVRLGLLTNEEAEKRFHSYMLACRKGMGEDTYFSASWGEMHELIGSADSCRISMDANPTWPGIRMQLFEMARWQHTHRVLFTNDPDHVCVRTRPEWAKSILSLISLNGALCLLSDTPDSYTDEKLDIIRRTMPPIASMTGETGPLSLDYPAYTWTKLHGFAVQSHETPVEMEEVNLEDALDMAGNYPGQDSNHPFSTLWNFAIDHHDYKWNVIMRVATVPLKESTLTAEQLNLEKDTDYLVFDFWNEQFLGCFSDEIPVKALGLGTCQVLSFRKKSTNIQLISSTRHVSMDAISVEKQVNENNSLKIFLKGIEGRSDKYFFYIPEGKTIKSASHPCSIEENIAVVTVHFTSTQEVITLTY